MLVLQNILQLRYAAFLGAIAFSLIFGIWGMVAPQHLWAVLPLFAAAFSLVLLGIFDLC